MDAPPNSRLLVKNIPFSAKEKDIIKEFSKKGQLTDCKIIRKQTNNKSRGFCFVGYKTVEEATEALKYFNGTYIGTNKISVEYALPIGTEKLEETRARRKKHEKEQRQMEQKIEKTKKEFKKEGIDENDPKWQEFLSAQVKHNERASWNDGFGFAEQYMQPEEQESENGGENDDENHEEEDNQDEGNEKQPKSKAVLTSSRLYVINIPYKATAEEVKQEFEKFGEVADVHLQAGAPGENSGAGYVKFVDIDSARKALDTAVIMMGRHLKLEPSKPEPEKKKTVLIQDDDMSFKEKKAQRLKEHRPESYNPFFMNKDTIADAIAHRIGMTRADVLNPESDDAASRLAVAESQLVEETKQLFEENGINVDLLSKETSSRVDLSRTVLIVKNLRWETTEEELRAMFAAKGTLVRFVLAPTHSLAIVEFARADEARKALESLNYRPLHDSPLFIQWAPEGTTTGPGGESDERRSRPKVEIKTTTLIVKNLPFQAGKSDVRNVCSTYGNIKAIRMSKKPDGSGHRGFCFLDFATRQEAQSAYDSLQNVHLYGRHLIVQPAQEGKHETTKTQKDVGDVVTTVINRDYDDDIAEPPKAQAE